MSRENGNRPVRPMITAAELQSRLDELAAEITRDYAGSERFVVIGVLKGSVFFLVDLLRRIELPLELDFCQTSSYGSRTTAGEIRLKKDVELALRDADVLVIEDIVDTGWTLRLLLDLFRNRRPKSLRLCSLLDKAAAREVEIPIDYRGFVIEPVFVVGYGLDWDERYRQLPFIGVVEDAPKGEEMP